MTSYHNVQATNSAVQWDRIPPKYNKEYAKPNSRQKRDTDSLKAQWYRMYQTRKLTGDPNIPAYIRHAKEIHERMDSEVGIIKINNTQYGSTEEEEELVDKEDEETQFYNLETTMTLGDNSRVDIADQLYSYYPT
ncbi:hypothetical protein RUND412_000523 [Rhizina undulata]